VDERPVQVLIEAMRLAVTRLPDEVLGALQDAHQAESELGRTQLETMIANAEVASAEGLPLCQDTGLPTFRVLVGHEFPHRADVGEWIRTAVRRATEEVPLRPNVVDLLTHRNTNDNTGRGVPMIDWEPVPGTDCRIDVLPKGGGSENCSALRMLTPSEGFSGVKRFVAKYVASCGGRPCPPGFIGVGIGGGADTAMKLAKRSLYRPLGDPHPEPEIAALETELLGLVNASGLGPMGLRGRTTALAVHVEIADRHPASYPVGLVYQCWAHRRATMEINAEGVASLVSAGGSIPGKDE